MIINHNTGQPITLRRILGLFPSVCAFDNPGIGTPEFIAAGIRGPWGSPPTDAQLRSVGYSYLVETAPPQPGPGERVRQGAPALIEDQWRQTWIVEAIPVSVPDAVQKHHLARVLRQAGQLRAVVNYFNSLAADHPMREDWQSMIEVHRDDAVIEALRVALNRTHAQVDALFIAAGAERVRASV